MLLVSACLLGQRTRYDGRHSLCDELAERLAGRRVLALCPEVLGGLGVPRFPARIVGGRFGSEGRDILTGLARLMDSRGRDVTAEFVAGARRAADLAVAAGVTACFLKDRSPSCACDPLGRNPDGGPGQGVLTALMSARGVPVWEVRAAARPA